MSTDDVFGDEVYEGQDDNPQLDQGDTLDGDLALDPLDTGYSPPDYEPKNTRYGTTELEQLEGESLDQKLAEEEPDLALDDGTEKDEDWDGFSSDPRAGRLVAPDEGAHEDEESDSIASDVGIDGAAASAEEAAMHVIEDDDFTG